MNNKRYVKVMFGNKSGANGYEYKIGKVNIAEYWNPNDLDAKICEDLIFQQKIKK